MLKVVRGNETAKLADVCKSNEKIRGRRIQMKTNVNATMNATMNIGKRSMQSFLRNHLNHRVEIIRRVSHPF